LLGLPAPGFVDPELVPACASLHPLSGAPAVAAEARACFSTEICCAHAGAWFAMAIATIKIIRFLLGMNVGRPVIMARPDWATAVARADASRSERRGEPGQVVRVVPARTR